MTTSFDNILKFEQGKLTDAEILALFSDLITTGDIWKLPPNYGEMAAMLIESGRIKSNNAKVN